MYLQIKALRDYSHYFIMFNRAPETKNRKGRKARFVLQANVDLGTICKDGQKHLTYQGTCHIHCLPACLFLLRLLQHCHSIPVAEMSFASW